nr:CHAT domain-containing protein [Streptomyces sp. SID12488]
MTTTDGEGREDTIREVLRWLWRTVASPVLDALAALPELPGAPEDTHVWWIPTGPLTTLPLHAATAADGYSVLDRVTSSYTPTVSALIRARKTRDTPVLGQRAGQRHLLVAPAAGHLPAAARTLAKLAVLLPRKQRTTLVGPEATWDEVRKALPQHAWTHIDCHAVQSLDEPLKSHLSLHDRPLTVADLAELPSGEADFALLAACTTAAGGSLVRDEWVSLAAALMYSEFQAVIGTLWPVPDGPTARIAQDIYAELIPLPAEGTTDRTTAKPPMRRRLVRWLRRLITSSGQESQEPASRRVDLNSRRSAHALRRALLSERARRPDHPSAWVSFVHYGV